MENYGDEGFIRFLRNSQEAARNKDIQKGSVYAGDKELVFHEREILKKQLWMWIPDEFAPLGKEMARVKYPSEQRPDLIYTNPETTVNVSFSHKQDKMDDGQEVSVRDCMEPLIKKLYPSCSVDHGSVQAVDHEVAWLDFVSPAMDLPVYNLMFFTTVKNRLLLGSFNCLEADQDNWKDFFTQMLATIRTADKGR